MQASWNFARRKNRTAPTTFVAPNLVEGTLEQGFEICRSLEMPFQRVVFMMLLVFKVHPFADGNSPIARIMMNADQETAKTPAEAISL